MNAPRILLFGTALLFACQPPEKVPNATPDAGPKRIAIKVRTEIVQPQTFDDRIELNSVTEAIDDAQLSAQSMGTIQKLLALGTEVKAKQLVVQLDPDLVKAAVRQARATVEAARAAAELTEANYLRQKPLFEEKVISFIEFTRIQSEYAQSKAQLAQAEATLAQAKEQLINTRILAPFSGIIEAHYKQLGEQVNVGEPVVRVTNTQTMRMKAGVPERYAADIQMGTPVEIRFNAYGLGSTTGQLTFVGSNIDPQSRTFPIEAEIPNPDRRLKPQMVARLLLSRATISEALVVPVTAMVRDETGNALFVVEQTPEGPVVARRSITVGNISSGKVVVKKGLRSGDEVVTSGQNNLTRGDLVDVVDRERVKAQASQP